MPDIPLLQVGHPSLCPKHTKESRSINVEFSDMMRYSVSLGGINGRKLSRNGRAFFRELIRMALEDRNGTLAITDDYLFAEPSVRNTITFYLGMIAAKAIAEKEYGISHLFHFADKSIKSISNNAKRPDFFGIRDNTACLPFLLEAKGTINNAVDSHRLNDAVEQLQSIKSLNLITSRKTKTYSQFERRIACSAFRNRRLQFYDIDPPDQGGQEVNLLADKAILDYYDNALSILRDYAAFDNRSFTARSFSGLDYVIASDGDVHVGLYKGLLRPLLEAEQNGSEMAVHSDGLFETIIAILEEKRGSFEKGNNIAGANISIGLDGMLLLATHT